MSVSSEYSLDWYSKEDFIITFSASPRTALAPWRSARTSRSKMRREISSVGKDYANKKADTKDSATIFIPSTLSCVIVSHNAVSHIVFSSFRESSYFRGEAVRNVFKNKFPHKYKGAVRNKVQVASPLSRTSLPQTAILWLCPPTLPPLDLCSWKICCNTAQYTLPE